MLVCIKPLLWHDGYTEVRCLPDSGDGQVTLVANESDVAQRFPDHFRMLDPNLAPPSRERYLSTQMGPARIREGSTVRPARGDLGKERWRIPESSATCRASRDQSSARLRLDTTAYQDLVKIYTASMLQDGDEDGGLLWGVHRGDLIEILAATGSGPDAIRRRTSFSHDSSFNAQQLTTMRTRGLELIGEHHGHPSGYRALSTSDLTAHAGRRRLAGVPRYAAVVVTAGGQDGIELDWWVMRPFTNECDVAEEARLD
jgi:hypothetical protein